jgi:Lrp/AsnC family transcriptional regulator, regulator for asnA, asnC and gidA
MQLDATDEAIINVLLTNSKLSFRDISSKIGVSSVTILNRIKKLEKEKIIKDYTINIDYDKAGISFSAFLEIKTKEILLIKEELLNLQNISFIYEVSGDHNLIALTHIKQKTELHKLISRLQNNKNIESLKTKLILNTIKSGKNQL